MTEEKKPHQPPKPQQNPSKPLTEEKGLPPVDQTPNMPAVKPPKK